MSLVYAHGSSLSLRQGHVFISLTQVSIFLPLSSLSPLLFYLILFHVPVVSYFIITVHVFTGIGIKGCVSNMSLSMCYFGLSFSPSSSTGFYLFLFTCCCLLLYYGSGYIFWDSYKGLSLICPQVNVISGSRKRTQRTLHRIIKEGV